MVLIVFFVGIIRTYFTTEKTQKLLEGKSLFTGNILASLLGILTPFCSCSSVPLFIGFVRGGIPLGVTFSFLITSPLVNEVAIGLFVGLFGLKTTIIYVISGVLLGTISGVILQKLKLDSYLTPWVKTVLENAQKEQAIFVAQKEPLLQRLPIIWA